MESTCLSPATEKAAVEYSWARTRGLGSLFVRGGQSRESERHLTRNYLLSLPPPYKPCSPPESSCSLGIPGEPSLTVIFPSKSPFQQFELHSSNSGPSANVLFGGGAGPAEQRECRECFFNQMNYCWESSHFSPFNLYSVGNPSNTPSPGVKQDLRDAGSEQGGRQEMGWSAGNERPMGGQGSRKAGGGTQLRGHGREGEKGFARFFAGKLAQAQARLVWAESGMGWLRASGLTSGACHLQGRGLAPGRSGAARDGGSYQALLEFVK